VELVETSGASFCSNGVNWRNIAISLIATGMKQSTMTFEVTPDQPAVHSIEAEEGGDAVEANEDGNEDKQQAQRTRPGVI
jgi:hypothetical protein